MPCFRALGIQTESILEFNFVPAMGLKNFPLFFPILGQNWVVSDGFRH